RDRHTYLSSLSWGSRPFFLWAEAQEQGAREGAVAVSLPDRHHDFRRAAAGFADAEVDWTGFREICMVVAVAIVCWPVLWSVWAFLFRGGLSFRTAAIALVSSDGAPASRLRWAWRTLLAWLPAAVLLGTSAALEGWYWSAAGRNAPAAPES